MISLGAWPLVTLAAARMKRDDARRLLLEGVDPVEQKRGDAEERERRARGMFEPIALEWLAHKKKGVGTETYRKAKLVTQGDLIPALKRHHIATLATKDCTQEHGRAQAGTPDTNAHIVCALLRETKK